MLKTRLFVLIFVALSVAAQTQPNSDVKFVADTLIVRKNKTAKTNTGKGVQPAIICRNLGST